MVTLETQINKTTENSGDDELGRGPQTSTEQETRERKLVQLRNLAQVPPSYQSELNEMAPPIVYQSL